MIRTNNKKSKKSNEIKALYNRVLLLYKEYCLKFDVSLYFAIHCLDMIKNAAKTQNKDVLKAFESIFNTIPYNKKIEQEILNSIRYK